MKDPTSKQLEREEQEFYGIEDMEREQRRAEAAEFYMGISRQDLGEEEGKGRV
jgi:hypothetical protein